MIHDLVCGSRSRAPFELPGCWAGKSGWPFPPVYGIMRWTGTGTAHRRPPHHTTALGALDCPQPSAGLPFTRCQEKDPCLRIQTNPPIEELDSLLQSGISAARVGHDGWAREMLTRAVELEPDCLQGWLWLSGVAWTPEDKARCLEQVLRLDPEHDDARRGLEHIASARAQTRQRPYAESEPPPPADPGGRTHGSAPTGVRPRDPRPDWDPSVIPEPEPRSAPQPVAELSPSLAYSYPGLPDLGPGPDPYLSPEPEPGRPAAGRHRRRRGPPGRRGPRAVGARHPGRREAHRGLAVAELRGRHRPGARRLCEKDADRRRGRCHAQAPGGFTICSLPGPGRFCAT